MPFMNAYRRLVLFTVGILILATMPSVAQESKILADGAKLEKLAGDYGFTEGPAADAEGNVYFTDQPNNRILRWNADDETVEEWMKPAGRANGLFLIPTGNLLAAADENNQLWSIAPDKTVTVLVDMVDGQLLNGPNDIWAGEQGNIYFTDPLYRRDYWKRDPAMQQPGQYVYLLPAGSKVPKAIATDLEQPNGIIGSPDGKTLYIADIGTNRTYAYDVQNDGSLKNKRLFCELGSDGMTVDRQGNVYLTGRGVTVFDHTGKQIQHIDLPQPWTSNVTFSGKEHNLLFITACKAVYTLETVVQGPRAETGTSPGNDGGDD